MELKHDPFVTSKQNLAIRQQEMYQNLLRCKSSIHSWLCVTLISFKFGIVICGISVVAGVA